MLVADDGIEGRNTIMETKIVNIINEMAEYLDAAQLRQLQEVLLSHLADNAIDVFDNLKIGQMNITPKLTTT